MRNITLITTGGTIEKTYNEESGTLENTRPMVQRMLRRLRLEETKVHLVHLMSKDSLLMTDADRQDISRAVVEAFSARSEQQCPVGVVVLHGTDTLDQTGEHLHRTLGALKGPVILTGAMRPFEMIRSDAMQNLIEAIFAAGVLPPGVYCVAHGRALRFPGVTKDRERRTFVESPRPPAQA